MDGGGFWQYVVMPFGLCNAPVGFEQLMIIALKDILSSVFLGALTVLTTISHQVSEDNTKTWNWSLYIAPKLSQDPWLCTNENESKADPDKTEAVKALLTPRGWTNCSSMILLPTTTTVWEIRMNT